MSGIIKPIGKALGGILGGVSGLLGGRPPAAPQARSMPSLLGNFEASMASDAVRRKAGQAQGRASTLLSVDQPQAPMQLASKSLLGG